MLRLALLLIAGTAVLFAAPVAAATDQVDLSVGMKTLPLLTSKIEGMATVAIIYDPAVPASRDEAAGIKAVLDGEFVAPGDLKITALLVPANNLGKMAGSKIAVLTSGLNGYYDAIDAAARAGNVLTMSTDLDCVRANKCVLGIVSKPHVEIYYSKIAADAAKIGFASAFTMLAKQI